MHTMHITRGTVLAAATTVAESATWHSMQNSAFVTASACGRKVWEREERRKTLAIYLPKNSSTHAETVAFAVIGSRVVRYGGSRIRRNCSRRRRYNIPLTLFNGKKRGRCLKNCLCMCMLERREVHRTRRTDVTGVTFSRVSCATALVRPQAHRPTDQPTLHRRAPCSTSSSSPADGNPVWPNERGTLSLTHKCNWIINYVLESVDECSNTQEILLD